MSIESLAIALNHSRAKGAAKLVLIGIANHDGDGGSWPSVATLARYACVTTRNVQKAVEALEELREIVRVPNAGGTTQTPDHMRPNLYRFTLTCPPTCDHTSRHRVRGEVVMTELGDPLSPATPPVASDTPTPVASDTSPLSPATPEPSSNRPSKRSPEVSTEHRCSMSRSGLHDFRFGRHCGWCGQRSDVAS